MRDALEISDESHKHGQPLDLRLVVCGPAADQFLKGMSSETKKSYEELSARSDIHLYVCEPTLKRIGKELKDMLSGFTLVASGPFEVLSLEKQGYLYLKP
jgi:intracellular sulfur oxidation DsrE/DsrF family protein